MIALTRMNGRTVFVNPDLVLFIEATPDTVISFRDGQTLIVREEAREVVKRFLSHARRLRSLSENLAQETG